MKKTIFIFVLIIFSSAVFSQTYNPYPIINSLLSKENAQLPLLDSAYKMLSLNFKSKGWSFLSKTEKKELKKAIKRASGFRINQDSVGQYKLISSEKVFSILTHPDFGKDSNVTSQLPHSYQVTAPVFFDDGNKAVSHVHLIKGNSYYAVLEKKDEKWVVIKEVLQIL